MSDGDKCLICGKGHLYEQEEDNLIVYKDKELYVKCYYSVCDVCGIETVDEEQARKNKEIVAVAKSEVY